MRMRWGHYYMKNFIKGKWFPLVLTLLTLVVVAIVAFLLGFRITYAPELENSWDAISAVASWASVAASFIAVWTAIQVPEKIAEQQEKVELYEKRLDFYNTIDMCIRFAYTIDSLLPNAAIKYLFVITFENETKPSRVKEEIERQVTFVFCKVVESLKHGEFLFEYDVKKYTKAIVESLTDLVVPETLEGDNRRERVTKYVTAVKDTQENLLPLIKDSLTLWSNK